MNIKHISTTALLAGIMALPMMTSCGDNATNWPKCAARTPSPK